MKGRKNLGIRLLIKGIVCLDWLMTSILNVFNNDRTSIFLKWETREQTDAYGFLNIKKPATKSTKNKVGILIPFRDHFDLTFMCLESLLNQNLKNCELEVVLINNGSVEEKTAEGVELFKSRFAERGMLVKHLDCDYEFNFSRLINDGAKACGTVEFFLLLNNDIQFTDPDTLEDLVTFYKNTSKIGALGITLLYPNNRIQHLFLAPGVKIVGAHPGKGWMFNPKHEWFQKPRPVAATTGALLLVETNIFHEIGGLDEILGQNYQDLDFCLELQKRGLVNWVASHISAIHHEGASRKTNPPVKEVVHMYQKWGDTLHYNVFFNAIYSRWSEYPVRRSIDRRYPLNQVLNLNL